MAPARSSHRRDGKIHQERRAEAERRAQAKWRELRNQHVEGPVREDVTLGWLFREYLAEKRDQAEAGEIKPFTVDAIEWVLTCIERFLGAETDPRTLDVRQWKAFRRARRSGAIDSRGTSVPQGKRREVSGRTVNADLMQLRTVLEEMAGYRDPEGRPYLREYPVGNKKRFELYELPDRQATRRPIVTDDQYRALLEAADDVRTYVGTRGGSNASRSWFREMLIVANETGRRLGAIRHLRIKD